MAGGPAAWLPSDESRAWHLALAVVLVSAVVRVALAAALPLFPDETYYWEWTRRPAASYFDHPPGIAAVIAFGTALFGETRIGVRFGAIAVGLVGSIAAVAVARRLLDGRAALVTALALAVMPMAAAGLVLATPDAPLLAALAIAVWALTRAIEQEPGTVKEMGWWCVTGLALGAALLSKYTAVLLPAGALLAFAVDPRLRNRILTPGPWVAMGLGVAAFTPVIMWNAELGWPSFAFQLAHGFGGSESDAGALGRLVQALGRLLEYVGGQIGLVSPILFGLMAIVVIGALRSGARASGDERLTALAGIGALVFVLFAISSLRRHVEPNWPAPAYLIGVVLLGVGWRRIGGAWLTWGLALGAIAVTLIYVQALIPVLPVDARRDPIAQAHGWDDLAAAAVDARSGLSNLGCETVWIAANRYQEASQLAFHVPDRPTVFSLNVGRRSNQYALWPDFEDLATVGDCLVFVDIDHPGTHRLADRLAESFDSAADVGPRDRLRRDGVNASYRLWAFSGWTGRALGGDP